MNQPSPTSGARSEPSGTATPGWFPESGAPGPYGPPVGYGDPFDFDLLLINQRALSVADRYDVLDEYGMPRFYVHRHLKMGGMALAGVVRLIFVVAVFYYGFRLVLSGHLLPALILLWAMGPVAELLFNSLAPLRHVYLYLPGMPEDQPLLVISQDNRVSLWRRFTLFDDLGQPVAQFMKPKWTNLYRRRWKVFTPDGQLICEMREDTWIRSILRRFLGTFFGLLKTDFHLYDPEGNFLGTYRRRWTLLDRYVLDLSADAWRRLDRRVGLAAGILLDTGERR
jgi:hypothetical protein